MEISLTGLTDHTVGVRWTLIVSALVEEENETVARMEGGPERLQLLEHLLDDLEHYVDTGEMRV